MYILKKIGQISLPCFTPLATVKCVEVVVPQRAQIFLCVYQKHNTIIINSGTCFFKPIYQIVASNLICQNPY